MKDFLKVTLAIQFGVFVAIGLDILIARQVITCVYLTIIPGFLILKMFKLHKTSFVDTILFSAGLSIVFLMFVGLLMNQLLPLLGILRPLSTIPLIITISVLTLILLFFNYKEYLAEHKNTNLTDTESRTVTSKALLFVFLPLLSIIGALYINVPILLMMIIAITALYALTVFSKRLIPTGLYPLLIFVVSTALIFHTSLMSKYLIGYDVHREYFVFRLTETNGCWQRVCIVTDPSRPDLLPIANFNSVLSITILPTVYSCFLNINGELIFKIIYPLVFCLVPLALYRIYEKQTEKLVAVLSTFFFMSTHVFYGIEMLSLARQIIAELFLVLAVLLLVDKKMAPRKSRLLFLIFGVALIVSHYSLAFIFLFYIILTFALSYKKNGEKMLNGALVLLLIITTFSWYTYVSPSPTLTLINSFQNIYDMLIIDLFNPATRIPEATWAIQHSIVATLVDRMLFYIRNLFILVGVLWLIVKPDETKFSSEYRSMSILSMFILFLCVAIPNFATKLNITRFYQITLLFLAPFFVIGGKTLFSWIGKVTSSFSNKLRKSSYENLELQMVSIVLIASFLFQVGFISRVIEDTPSFSSLDISRMKTTNNLKIKNDFYNAYTPEQDVYSAIWLSENMNKTSRIYADPVSRSHVLASYGLIPGEQISLLTSSTKLGHGTYIYLRHLNIIDGSISQFGHGLAPFNISEISSLLSESNKIYSSGDSEIYCAP